MADARISTSLPAHPKTKKLMRRLGGACGGWYLVRLFLWVAENRSNGDLSGMTDEDIELAVDFDGEEGALISALCDVGFMDGEQGERVIHDWEEHNPWAAGADARSIKAKWNAMKRHHGEQVADKAYPEYAAIRPKRDNDQHASSTNSAQKQDETSSAPYPYPSPLPSPSPNPLPTIVNTAAPSALDGKPSNEDVPMTTKEEIWKAGKSILEAAGVPKAQCGSFVGKLVKDYGDDVVVEAVRQTVLENPADPREYLKALCIRAKGQKPKASMPKPENFANKDYGQGIRLL